MCVCVRATRPFQDQGPGLLLGIGPIFGPTLFISSGTFRPSIYDKQSEHHRDLHGRMKRLKRVWGGGQGDVHGRRTSVYGSVLNRAVKQIDGTLSRTRAVADATVARARRLFFRDAG